MPDRITVHIDADSGAVTREARKTTVEIRKVAASVEAADAKQRASALRTEAARRKLTQTTEKYGAESSKAKDDVLRLERAEVSQTRATLELERAHARVNKQIGATDKAYSGLTGKMRDFNQATTATKNVMGLLRWPALIAGAGAAAQALGAVAAGGIAVGSSLGTMAPLVGVLPGAAAAAGQAMGVWKLASKDLTEALGGNEDALKRLTPEARAFVKTLKSYKPVIEDLRRTAQRGLFPGLEDGLKRAAGNVGVLKSIVAETSLALGDVARQTGTLAGSKDFGRDAGTVGKANAENLRIAGDAANHLLDALVQVTVVAGPTLHGLVVDADKLAAAIDRAAHDARDSGGMADAFHKAREELDLVLSIGQSLGHALFNIARAAVPTGDSLLGKLDESAQTWEDWTGSMTGQNEMEGYFARAQPTVEALADLVADVAAAFVRLSDGGEVDDVIAKLDELVPTVEALLETTTEALGPGLVDMLGEATTLFAALAGDSGPVVLLIDALAGVLGGINDIMEAIPEIKPVVATLAGAASIYAALRIGSSIFGIGRIITLLKDARIAAMGLAVAQGATGFAGGAPKGASKTGGLTVFGPAGAGAASGAAGRIGGLAAGAGGLATGAVVGLGLTKAISDALKGGSQGDLGLLTKTLGVKVSGKNNNQDEILKATTARMRELLASGNVEKAKALATQLREVAQANQDITKGDHLKAFAKQLEDAAARGAPAMKQLANAIDGVGGKAPSWNLPKLNIAGLGADSKKLEVWAQSANAAVTKLGNAGNAKGLRGVADEARALAREFPGSAKQLRDFARQVDDTAKNSVVPDFVAMKDAAGHSLHAIQTTVASTTKDIKQRLGNDTKDGKDALSHNFDLAVKAVQTSMRDGTISTEHGLAEIRRLLSQQLKLFGVGTKIADAGKGLGDAALGALSKGAATGYIGNPGEKGRDKIPLLVGRGEAVLNGPQQGIVNGALQAVGIRGLPEVFQRERTPHYMAKGGFAGSLMGAAPGLAPYAADASKYGLTVSSGLRPGAITNAGYVSNHSIGRAIDLAGSAPNMLRYGLHAARIYGSQLEELIHTPMGFGIKNGQRVPPYAAADHYDHVHLADLQDATGKLLAAAGAVSGVSGAVGGGPMGPPEKLKRVLIAKGLGEVGRVGQGALDIARRAADKRLAQLVMGGSGAVSSGPAGKGGGAAGATTFGGPMDTDSGVGYRGDVLAQHPDSFAELSRNAGALDFSAMGGLPYMARVRVAVPSTGKSMILYKRDIGAGGPPVDGKPREIDLWYQAAQQLGLPPVWSGTVNWNRAAQGYLPAATGHEGDEKAARISKATKDTKKKVTDEVSQHKKAEAKKKRPSTDSIIKQWRNTTLSVPTSALESIATITGTTLPDLLDDYGRLERKQDQTDEDSAISGLLDNGPDDKPKYTQDFINQEFARLVQQHVGEVDARVHVQQMQESYYNGLGGVIPLSGFATQQLQAMIQERKAIALETEDSARRNVDRIRDTQGDAEFEKGKKATWQQKLARNRDRLRDWRGDLRWEQGRSFKDMASIEDLSEQIIRAEGENARLSKDKPKAGAVSWRKARLSNSLDAWRDLGGTLVGNRGEKPSFTDPPQGSKLAIRRVMVTNAQTQLDELTSKSHGFPGALADVKLNIEDLMLERSAWAGRAAPVLPKVDATTDSALDSAIADQATRRADEAEKQLALVRSQNNVFAGIAPMLKGRYMGSFAVGTDHVDRTGLAIVHRDERIVPDPKGGYGRMDTSAQPVVNVELVVEGDVGGLIRLVDTRINGRSAAVANQQIGRSSRLIGAAPGGR